MLMTINAIIYYAINFSKSLMTRSTYHSSYRTYKDLRFNDNVCLWRVDVYAVDNFRA